MDSKEKKEQTENGFKKVLRNVGNFFSKIGKAIAGFFKKSVTKTVLSIALNVLLCLVFIVSIITAVTTLNTKNGISNIFGFGYLSVQSNSMKPTFQAGDLIFVTTTNESSQFEVGDVVTFNIIVEGHTILNTHRIISYSTVGNTRYYVTQGDNNPNSDDGTITAGDIVAKYTGAKMPGVGVVVDYIQSSTGFLICIVLPLALLFIYQIISFALLLAKFKKENLASANNAKIDIASLNESEKAEIARQYLESLNKQNSKADNAQNNETEQIEKK